MSCEDFFFFFLIVAKAARVFAVTIHFNTHSHTHTHTDTHQLNWVIRAIYIIIQASGRFNSGVCGNVLVGTAVHSDRRRKQDSRALYILSDVDVKLNSRQAERY